MTFAQQQAAAQPVSNAPTFADIETMFKALGTEGGRAKDAQVKMLLKLGDAGYLSVVDLNPNKHGTGIDDATKLAETYILSQGTATIFDSKAPNQRKLISCFRTMIRFGQWPKGGVGEPIGLMNRLMTVRQKLRQDPLKRKKLDDAANVLLSMARAQIKRDTLIADGELESFCWRKTNDLATPEQIIEASRKTLMRLAQGRAAHNTAIDTSQEVKDAIQALTARLKAIATQKGQQNTTRTAP